MNIIKDNFKIIFFNQICCVHVSILRLTGDYGKDPYNQPSHSISKNWASGSTANTKYII